MKKKRPLDRVEAARSLNSDGLLQNIHLLFVGSGELEKELREACHVVYDAEAERSHVSASFIPSGSPNALPRASFAGFLNQTEISRAYVAADCLVLPSGHGETWGLVVNEALASSLPCLVSDACGCAEDLAGKQFSFAMGDIGALREKLNGLLTERSIIVPPKPPSFDETILAIDRAYSDCVPRH
jgi:glycosyltransferase involved in cell wall biosynthesis